MAKKEKEEIRTDGWKDTFSDLMNLLLCFFVLLYSMSNVDQVKYAELVASLSNSFSIFTGGEKAVGDGQLVSSGASQLNNLDEYYSDMGKAKESQKEEDPMSELEKQQKEEQKKSTEKLYSDIVKKAENNRLQDAIEVSMDNSYQYVMISLSGGILFDSGSADIKKGASMIIGRVGDILKNYSNKRIKIEGHTDNVPIGSTSKYSSNWELSTARATSVLQYLAQKKGLNAKYLEASGRADVNPVVDNKTEKGRSKNRRVEIKIYSNND